MKRSKNSGKIAWTIFTLVFVFTNLALHAQQERSHSNFDRISFNISGDLYITQGDNYSVRLEGSDKDLEKIDTKVENNSLIIKTKHNSSLRDDVKIYVTLPELKAMNLAGSGDVYAKNKISASGLELSISGSGDVTFNELIANDVELSIAGSGDMMIKGKAEESLEMSIAGSGDIDAVQFEAKSVEVSISGSGSATVFATDNLETNIVGSGSVRYKGNPLVNANAVGSGSTKAL